MFSLLSGSKNFADSWVGSKKLNRLGLHINRMRLANLANTVRCRLSGAKKDKWTKLLNEQGYVVIPNFLPEQEFENLYSQVKASVEHSIEANPPSPPQTKGFGAKQLFDGGFDRYDGATLNRFLEIKTPCSASMSAFTSDPRLDSLCRSASGFSMDANRLQIYLTVNGDELNNPDAQRVLHRDTFHSSLKFWYFMEDVNEEDGPFAYIPGSHKVTAKRLKWEHHQALISCGDKKDSHSLNFCGGSFRLHEDDLEDLELSKPVSLPTTRNTLVLADTLGFHRRGSAASGTHRLALYGWRRPWPFIVKGW
jgi:hypothetical protein